MKIKLKLDTSKNRYAKSHTYENPLCVHIRPRVRTLCCRARFVSLNLCHCERCCSESATGWGGTGGSPTGWNGTDRGAASRVAEGLRPLREGPRVRRHRLRADLARHHAVR